MKWRYQPVYKIEPNGDKCFWLIEAHFDSDGRLESWFADEAEAFPVGETMDKVTSDLARMMVDAHCWVPMEYRKLKVGMVIQRLVSGKAREALAQMIERDEHNIRQARQE